MVDKVFFDGKKNVNLMKVGFVSKLNGYKGELVLATDIALNSKEKDFIFLEIDGLIVPFLIEDIFEKGGNTIIRFEDVNDEDAARSLVKKEVFVKAGKKPGQVNDVRWDELVGYNLQDEESGRQGRIERIEQFPNQVMATCIINEKEVLVPLNEEFVSVVDHDEKMVYVNLPEGLLDL